MKIVMKKAFICTALVAGILFTACNNTDDLDNALNDKSLKSSQENQIILVDADLYRNAPDDKFDYYDVEIIDDSLYVTVKYGGGCGIIEFNLIDSEAILESYPITRNIRLSFNDEDNCEAYLEKQLVYDLSPIKISEYHNIIINLKDWDSTLIYRY